MSAYIARRIFLMLPTLLGILFVSFVVVQFAPGGPVERVIAQINGADTGGTSRVSGGGGDFGAQRGQGAGAGAAINSKYRGAQGLDPDFIKKLEVQFGFDKPAPERFALMVWNFARFDFGNSYFRSVSVLQLIKEKLPVSMSLGIWMTLLTYLISIPLGIRKAVQDGSRFDTWTSAVIIIGFAIPGFLFAILLIVLFAGGSFLNIFPLRGLTSDGWAQFPWYWKIIDYFWHLTLPLVSMALGAFATMPPPARNAAPNPNRPRAPEIIQNFCSDHSSPACEMRRPRGTFLSFCRRASSSFNDPSTCSRRERCVRSAFRVVVGSLRATDARRDSAFFSPER